MIVLYALMVATLMGAGTYLILQKSLLRIFLGLSLLGYGANLFLFISSGMRRGSPPLIDELDVVLSPEASDPLPQALILTAIVIGLGTSAFFLVLARRAADDGERDNIDHIDRESV